MDPPAWRRRHDRRHGPERFPSPPGRTTAQPRGAPRGWSSEEGEGQPGRRGQQRQDVARSPRRFEDAGARGGQERTQARHQADGDEAVGGGGAETQAHRRGEREWARVETMRAQQAAAEARRRCADVATCRRPANIPAAVAEGGTVLLVLRTVGVRYPAASFADPASRATYEDSSWTRRPYRSAVVTQGSLGANPERSTARRCRSPRSPRLRTTSGASTLRDHDESWVDHAIATPAGYPGRNRVARCSPRSPRTTRPPEITGGCSGRRRGRRWRDLTGGT